MEEIHCNIKGRVQMVMYRDFSQRMARRYGVKGWVKNLKNGSVELVAQGEKDKLEEYFKLLNKGPILARVDSVDLMWRKPLEVFESFKIRY